MGLKKTRRTIEFESIAQFCHHQPRKVLEAKKNSDKVSVVTRLDLSDKYLWIEKLSKFKEMGIERLICGLPYNDLNDFLKKADFLKNL